LVIGEGARRRAVPSRRDPAEEATKKEPTSIAVIGSTGEGRRLLLLLLSVQGEKNPGRQSKNEEGNGVPRGGRNVQSTGTWGQAITVGGNWGHDGAANLKKAARQRKKTVAPSAVGKRISEKDSEEGLEKQTTQRGAADPRRLLRLRKPPKWRRCKR